MCGIAGGVGHPTRIIDGMLDRLAHRGPDGRGIACAGQTVHGHVRLALVDLTSASAQPFPRAGGLLSFNGEIWNWQALRKALTADGEHCLTQGDTEVLAAVLSREGIHGLSRLDGMFAFVWTSASGQTFLVRDRFGHIPLYLAKTPQGYLWASERKAFPRGMQPIAIPPGFIFQVEAGTFSPWYTLPPPVPLTAQQVQTLLREGVRKRFEADAPVCCLISGGLDSSLILALAREHTSDVVAFTAVYDPQSADARASRRLCAELDIPLFEVAITLSEETIIDAIRAIELPSKAQIEIAMLCLPLAQRIYAEGYRACLSGEAADELFGGYGHFCIQASRATNTGIVPLRLLQLAKMARGNFIRCNKAFMAAGVECRLPFMEDRLVEQAIQATKHVSPPGKVLLKQAAHGLVPAWVIARHKDTFQGGSGLSRDLAIRLHNPTIYYHAELRKYLGYLPQN